MMKIFTLLLAVLFAEASSAQTINNLAAAAAVKSTDIFPTYQGSNPATGATALQLQNFILPLATGNINFYVATYGSDSNSGIATATLTTNGSTSTSSPTLSFAAVSGVVANEMVWDLTTGNYVGEVQSVGSTTVTLTGNAAFAVGNGDSIAFAPAMLTHQHAANVAATYNWAGLYGPNINSSGTFTNVALTLPLLLGSPGGGTVQGSNGSTTNLVLTDNGTNYAINVASYATWSINQLRTAGTHGGIDLQSYATMFTGNFNTGGTLSNCGVLLNPLSNFEPEGVTWTIDATSIGCLIESRGYFVLDFSTVNFANAITVTGASQTLPLIYLDSTASFFAADNVAFTNTGNITYGGGSGGAINVFNGAFFETNSSTTNNGTVLKRTNAPGNGTVNIDTTSKFEPDIISQPIGTTGSCSASSFSGNYWAGKFTAAVCAGGTFILSGLPLAPNGYTCTAQDQTTPADTLKQTANSTSSVTFTSTTVANDVVAFQCTPW